MFLSLFLLILDQNLWDALPERFRAPRFLEPIGLGSGRYLDEEGGGHRPREVDTLWLEKSLLQARVGSKFSWKGIPLRCGGSAYKGVRARFSSFVDKTH